MWSILLKLFIKHCVTTLVVLGNVKTYNDCLFAVGFKWYERFLLWLQRQCDIVVTK